MSLTQPPPPDPADDVDRPPSRRFKILFTCAMLAIAIGYGWVWLIKTSRVVAEPPPILVLGAVTSTVAGHGPSDEVALRDSIADHLRAVPRLRLSTTSYETDSPDVDSTGDARLPQRTYGLAGSVERVQGGRYQLELRRTNVETDSIVYVYRVHGTTLSEVVQRMTVQVAMSFGLPIPARVDTIPTQ
jgi:hypothetical protein